MSDATANADQIKFWNGVTGEKWAQHNADMDRNLTDATSGVIALAAAKPGERIVDIGCGAGETSLLLADAVGDEGSVLGVDVSGPLLELARKRAGSRKNVRFVQGDAAFHAFTPHADLVFSRFGVMFFDKPAPAFANIRKALKPGGRLAFVCWRPPMENEWIRATVGTAQPLLPPQPPADPFAPGPFAFADPKRVESILGEAGFKSVKVEKLDGQMNLGPSVEHAVYQMTNLGPLSRALNEEGVDDATRAKVGKAVGETLDKIRKDGVIKPAIACWLVSAVN
ncbi:MAG: class I SAM-dependent methyltransferase [Alphaproteobacteria bacterium]|nr:class I SAM-dependent methyltransferase [Alphaproteobacteria bacterium]